MAASLIGHVGQARFVSGDRHISGSSFSSQSDRRAFDVAACMCRIGSGEPRLGSRFVRRSSHIRLLPHTSSGEDEPVRFGVFGISDHATPSARSCRKTVPSVHILWSRTASFLATATTARRRPFVRIKCMPQDFNCEPVMVRMSIAFAAAYKVARTSRSPALDIRPGLSVSPDWYRRGVRPK